LHRTGHRWLATAALGLTVLGLAAGPAQAYDYRLPSGPSDTPVRPDDQATHGIGADVVEILLPSVDELQQFRFDGPHMAPDPAIVVDRTPAVEPGFELSDAGIGIAIGAAALLGLGTLLMGRSRTLASA
jgi:hypothetical protein